MQGMHPRRQSKRRALGKALQQSLVHPWQLQSLQGGPAKVRRDCPTACDVDKAALQATPGVTCISFEILGWQIEESLCSHAAVQPCSTALQTAQSVSPASFSSPEGDVFVVCVLLAGHGTIQGEALWHEGVRVLPHCRQVAGGWVGG